MLRTIPEIALLSGWLSDWAKSLDPIRLLKYFSSLTTAAYGVYATMTDFHEKKHGKQVLSKNGRIGIAFLLLSSVIGFTADGAKDYQDTKESEKTKAAQKLLLDQETATLQSAKDITSQLVKTDTVLNQTTATTKTILDVSRRAEDQFSTTDITKILVVIDIPIDQGEVERWKWGGSCGMYKILKGNPNSDLGAFLFSTSAQIDFLTKNGKKEGLHMSAKEQSPSHLCESNNSDIEAYEPKKSVASQVPALQVLRAVLGTDWTNTYDGFRTYEDLNHAEVSISFQDWPPRTKALRYSIEKLYVSTSRGRYIRGREFHPCPNSDQAAFCGTVDIE